MFAFTRRRASREEDKGTFDSPMRWQIKTNNTTKWGKKMKVNLFFSYLQPRELRVLLHAPDGGALAVVHHRAFTRVSVCLCVRRVCSQPRGCETVERKRAAVQPKKRPSRQNPKIKRLKTQRLFFSLSAARCVCVRCACGPLRLPQLLQLAWPSLPHRRWGRCSVVMIPLNPSSCI